jgi:hypothetical protein
MTGFWGTSMLSSGPTENSWERGVLTVSADNSTTYSGVTSHETVTASSGTLSTAQSGTITLTGGADIDVYLDAEGTLLHGVTNNSGTAGLFTAVKKADSYSAGDIGGIWKANILVSGVSSPWWERGTVTVDSLGNFTASTVDLFGDPGYLTAGGSLNVSSDGLVSMPVFSTLQGVMDSDKGLIVWTDTWPDGTTELAVLTRQAASYATADLLGTWRFSSLSTGMVFSAARGVMTVSSGGVAAIVYENAGESGAYERRLLISGDGTLIIADKDGVLIPHVEGFMDAGRTVMVFTETLATDGLLSGSVMTVFTKQ